MILCEEQPTESVFRNNSPENKKSYIIYSLFVKVKDSIMH